MVKMAQNINYTFKMLYVLAIIMIVDGHVGQYDYLNFNHLFRYQNYHIALFMFTSGYFLNLERDLKEFLLKKLKTLILPLYLWNLFYGMLCFVLNHFAGFNIGSELSLYNLLYAPLTNGHQFIYNMGSWFLVPLFFVQLIGYLSLKPCLMLKEKQKTLVNLLFFMFALFCGCMSLRFGPQNHGEPNLSLMAVRIFYFMPAFALGYLYRQKLEQYDKLNTPLYLFIIMGLTALLCNYFPGYNHIPAWLDFVNAPALAIFTLSFLSIFFWLRIARILSPVLKESPSLKYISNHTFDIMMHHFAGFMLIKAALSRCPGFNYHAYQNDIWYYYFPSSEELSGWLYISITLVIALLTGFTNRKICATLKQFLCNKNSNSKGGIL